MKRTYTMMTLILFAASVMIFSGCESKTPPAEPTEPSSANPVAPETDQPQQPAAVTFDHVLGLWQAGQKDAAAAQFLTLNWQSPDIFEKDSIFALSEQQFAKLPRNQLQLVSQDAVAKSKLVKELAKYVVEQTKTLAAEGKKSQALQNYTALMECSKTLSGDNQLKLIQLVGQALPGFIQKELPDLQSP